MLKNDMYDPMQNAPVTKLVHMLNESWHSSEYKVGNKGDEGYDNDKEFLVKI